jgi:hypothetical protein
MSIQEDLKSVEIMPLSELGKWTHISSQLGYKNVFFKVTSALISRATADDFGRGPLFLDFQKLSQALQGDFERQFNLTIY